MEIVFDDVFKYLHCRQYPEDHCGVRNGIKFKKFVLVMEFFKAKIKAMNHRQ